MNTTVLLSVSLLMFALVIVTVIIAYLFAAKCPNLQLTGTRSWRSILSAGLLREQRNDDNVDIDTTLENDLEHIEAESSKEQRAKVDRKITPKHCPASQVVTQEVAVLVPRRGNLPRVSFSDPTWNQMTASRTSASSTTTNSRLQEQSQPLSQSLSSNGRGGAATPNELTKRKLPPPQNGKREAKQSKLTKSQRVSVRKRSTAETTCTTHGHKVLAEILDAQNGGLLYYPGYEVALDEIRNGSKLSCWMWYIWPSMHGIRSHRMPNLLLPNFQTAIDYLRHETLRYRLVKITKAAERTLSLGQSTTRLFGGVLDSTKVHESCTMFALAAIAIGSTEHAHLFVRVVQVYFGEPNKTVVEFFEELAEEETTNKPLTSELLHIADTYRQSTAVN